MQLRTSLVAALMIFLLIGGCGGATRIGGTATTSKTAAGAREALITFIADVQSGRYRAACSMYARRVLRSVNRYYRGGCEGSLDGLHAYAATQRAHGVPDVLSQAISDAKVASFSISGNVATTRGLGRRGTTTVLVYTRGRWNLDQPAT